MSLYMMMNRLQVISGQCQVCARTGIMTREIPCCSHFFYASDCGHYCYFSDIQPPDTPLGVRATPERFTCDECTQDYDNSELSDREDTCEGCYEDHFSHCRDCSTIVRNDDATTVNGSDLVCDRCAENYYTCEDCDELVHSDDTRSCHDDTLCESCFSSSCTMCADCREATRDDDIIVTSRDRSICQECYNDNYFTCDQCGDVLEDRYHSGEGVCDECANSADDDIDDSDEFDPATRHQGTFRSGSSVGIKNYSDKSSSDSLPIFGKLQSGDLPIPEFSDVCGVYVPRRHKGGMFGVELEVECRKDENRNDLARTVYERIGSDFVTIKEDGSLTNGFEIVTTRADLATHRARWTDLLSSPIDGLRSWGCSTTGLHIHYSRNGLGPLTLGKLLKFVNSPRNRRFIERIAGRSDNHYAVISEKRITDGIPAKCDKCKRIEPSTTNGSYCRRCDNPLSTRYTERYSAINLQNRHTIEFRLFKGSLKLSRVMMNLEFVAASIAFSRDHAEPELLHDVFCRWVAKSPKAYPALSAWLRENDIISKPKQRPVSVS
jgi:hypothetical protein